MFMEWLQGWRKYLTASCAALLVTAGAGRAEDPDLRRLIEEQGKQIQALKQQLEAQKTPVAADGQAQAAQPQLNEAAVKQIIAGYLKDNPGAGVPSGVQTGYKYGTGFSIASPPNPKYNNWDDDCRIPFELRFRGRIQLDYYGYKVTDRTNHQTNRPGSSPLPSGRLADFSQLEVKRLRLIWEGTAFTPNLRYNFTLDGNTRGLGGFQNNKVLETAGTAPTTLTPAGNTSSPNATLIGGGVSVDHAVRMFEAWVAYDWRPCWGEKGCAHECPDGTYNYSPTFTLIAGKQKPFFGIEEILSSQNEQMVEYSMADWFFDADDDNLMMAVGTRIKALEDRLYVVALITNGNESQFPNTQMDQYPGFNGGFWYDFGGEWNAEAKKWTLFGDYLSDLEYHCHPVLRVGGEFDIVPMGRRSLYGDDEQSRVFVTGPGNGGTRLINLLTGGNGAGFNNGQHAVDEFDSYSWGAFAALKYKGFSLWNEWYLRNLNGFHSAPQGRDQILYTDGLGRNALFPNQHALYDYGTTLQGGYFVIPKKLELVARFSWISGNSGDINGTGKVTTRTIPGVPGTVDVVNGAFRQYHDAREFAVGFNYYFKGQQLKWQTDFSIYDGGNPAGGGVSPAGFIAGTDGYMLRTQIQLAF
jgi:hypothetical protein